jgi:aspartate kinase|tara:strand:- start:63 stop:1316 length:1254 start_codon:yes stop_codon:yes gene_type:complete
MTKVFKFGGTSIKDANNIKRIAEILTKYASEDLVVVFSAIGKITNILEEVVESYMQKNGQAEDKLQLVKDFHAHLLGELFESNHAIYNEINNLFVEIEWVLEDEPNPDYAFNYDQIVSIGELLSTKIMSAYLNQNGFENFWMDARDIIRTDNKYRNARIDWKQTISSCKENIKSFPIITQGFIGCTSENFTTTLGREGSDFTAAILAFSLDAEQVIIWKDVDGVLNADPRFFEETEQLMSIPFEEAIELAYYGAKVMHPKTIQPLQKKSIPLEVKSFLNPKTESSIIGNFESITPFIPSYIVKENQILISIADKNLSFIVEEHLSSIFSLFSNFGTRVNMMQNSAVSFSFCIDNDSHKIPELLDALKKNFEVYFNENLIMYTIRHYNEDSISKLLINKELLLEQKSRHTVHLVVKEN